MKPSYLLCGQTLVECYKKKKSPPHKSDERIILINVFDLIHTFSAELIKPFISECSLLLNPIKSFKLFFYGKVRVVSEQPGLKHLSTSCYLLDVLWRVKAKVWCQLLSFFLSCTPPPPQLRSHARRLNTGCQNCKFCLCKYPISIGGLPKNEMCHRH